MTRPNFLVIGAMKAGTTALHRYLDSHPQVFMSATKELHFFVEELGWTNGWDWYEWHFEGAEGAVAVGESSPGYAAHPFRQGVPARIAGALPGARLVYLLRHPVERARSEYAHRWALGKERRPIGTALLEDPGYVWKSSYALQIEQYRRHFPRDQLLLVLSEDLRDRRAETMARIFGFLGVDPAWTSDAIDREFHRRRPAATTPSLARALRRVPGSSGLARRLPTAVTAVTEAYAARSRRRGERRLQVCEPLRRALEERLRPDLEALAALMPEALERWGLPAPPAGAR